VTVETKKKSGWLKWTLIVAAVVAVIVLYFWLKTTDRLGIFGSAEEFREWLGQFGAWAPAIYFLLQIAQVVVAFIPGEVTSVAGGIMFGFAGGMALSIFGITTGSIIAFAIARKLGRPAVIRLAGGSAVIDKYMDIVNRNSTWLLFTMFLLPFFPKDALCYVAGLTGIAWPVFILISFFGRLPGQIVSTLVGSGMLTVPIWGWVLILLASAGLVYLSFRYSERIGDLLMGKMRKKT
jgi:uncharacterized membrane protein YdjX (TVP38/TMEM64 family)